MLSLNFFKVDFFVIFLDKRKKKWTFGLYLKRVKNQQEALKGVENVQLREYSH